jgi:hypothetical protein
LQQKLKTDDDIKEFASKIVKQSGVYLRLNNDQMQLHLRNNEGNLSPTNPASVNKKTILVSMPPADENPSLSKFAQKLEDAFKSQFGNGAAQNSIVINKQSPRKDEMSIITIQYCFPIRAIDWLADYKGRYERFLNTGNPSTDVINSILLHSEGDGKNLPSLFALSEDEIAKVRAGREAANQTAQPQQMGMQQPQMGMQQPQMGMQQPQGMPNAMPGGMPNAMPQMQPEPEITVYFNVGGQNYGPYNRATCKQMVQNGQLTQQTMAWMEGMPAWLPAGQVPQLASLFQPAFPQSGPMPQGMPSI